jgi:hypothetical protein
VLAALRLEGMHQIAELLYLLRVRNNSKDQGKLARLGLNRARLFPPRLLEHWEAKSGTL